MVKNSKSCFIFPCIFPLSSSVTFDWLNCGILCCLESHSFTPLQPSFHSLKPSQHISFFRCMCRIHLSAHIPIVFVIAFAFTFIHCVTSLSVFTFVNRSKTIHFLHFTHFALTLHTARRLSRHFTRSTSMLVVVSRSHHRSGSRFFLSPKIPNWRLIDCLLPSPNLPVRWLDCTSGDVCACCCYVLCKCCGLWICLRSDRRSSGWQLRSFCCDLRGRRLLHSLLTHCIPCHSVCFRSDSFSYALLPRLLCSVSLMFFAVCVARGVAARSASIEFRGSIPPMDTSVGCRFVSGSSIWLY